MPRGLKIFNAVFLMTGSVLLAVGMYVTASRFHLQRVGISAHGQVIRLQASLDSKGTSYYPVVEYMTHDGKMATFTSRVGSSPPSFRVGEEVGVIYDPDHPEDAYIRTFWQFWGLSVLMLGLGVVFAGISTGIILSRARGRRRALWLKQYGRRISTKFVRVDVVTSITVNGRNPYRIVSEGLDPFAGETRIFQSYNLWNDPTSYIADRTIDVLIDPNDPRKYWLDTDFLSDLAD
jgi:hypothetical protein